MLLFSSLSQIFDVALAFGVTFWSNFWKAASKRIQQSIFSLYWKKKSRQISASLKIFPLKTISYFYLCLLNPFYNLLRFGAVYKIMWDWNHPSRFLTTSNNKETFFFSFCSLSLSLFVRINIPLERLPRFVWRTAGKNQRLYLFIQMNFQFWWTLEFINGLKGW